MSKKTDEKVFDAILETMATSTVGLKHICKENGISYQTFYNWLKVDVKNVDKYTRAREAQMEYMAEELLEIADDGSNDLMTITKGDASYEMENKEVTSRSKLRVETRKWLMSKFLPKKYGDKIDLTSGNEKIEIKVDFK